MKLPQGIRVSPLPPLHHCQEVGEAALCLCEGCGDVAGQPRPLASPPAPLPPPHGDGAPPLACCGSPGRLRRPGGRPSPTCGHHGHVYRTCGCFLSVTTSDPHHHSVGPFLAWALPSLVPQPPADWYIQRFFVFCLTPVASVWSAHPPWNEGLLSIVC